VFAMLYKIITRFMDRHLRRKGLPTEAYAYASSGVHYPDKKGRRKLEGDFHESKSAVVTETKASEAKDAAESTDAGDAGTGEDK
ncbi:MAG: hypothetical protein VZQ83_08515, partial [Eubacterium sp.]|nr:hypothetical protein [Eubacterium sp.]